MPAKAKSVTDSVGASHVRALGSPATILTGRLKLSRRMGKQPNQYSQKKTIANINRIEESDRRKDKYRDARDYPQTITIETFGCGWCKPRKDKCQSGRSGEDRETKDHWLQTTQPHIQRPKLFTDRVTPTA